MDDLDRILSSETRLQPSPEFTATVMAAIHRQSDAPSPLPFPWRRAALGGGVCLALTLGAALLALLLPHVPGPTMTGGAAGAIPGAGAVAALLRARLLTWPPTVPALLLLSLAGSYLPLRLSLRRPGE